MYRNREHQASQTIIEELSARATRDAQIAKYGKDVSIYGWSLVAYLDDFDIEPEYADKIREAIVAWKCTSSYRDYSTDSVEHTLFEIYPSEKTVRLCKRLAADAYHAEEAKAGLL